MGHHLAAHRQPTDVHWISIRMSGPGKYEKDWIGKVRQGCGRETRLPVRVEEWIGITTVPFSDIKVTFFNERV